MPRIYGVKNTSPFQSDIMTWSLYVMPYLLPANLLFLMFMTLGIFISISASSWPVAWIGLEINLLRFAPLIATPITKKSANAAATYFLAQATGSVLFLIGPMIAGLTLTPAPTAPLPTRLIIFGLIVKLGSAPAHLWLPAVAGRLPFWATFLLLTTQKIAPLALCANLAKDLDWAAILIGLGVLNACVGAHGAFVQTDIRQLLAYSSIGHLGWMLCLLPLTTSYPLIYLAGYALTLAPVMYHFSPIMSTSVKRFRLLRRQAPAIKQSFLTVLFNLRGLPPFGGFFIKLLALTILTISGHWWVALTLAFARILTLTAYTNLTFMLLITGVKPSYFKQALRTASTYTLFAAPIVIALPFLITL